ncbi:histidinol-phosphate transaminase [Algicola sagamiensis]|uniref:histidinol-phosphate transaminase n=1 Tax=Algicola sagamiensis TaxID=163869 RepID=UPI0003708B52|nr:histidinol-phosphate transaminase [Algicola sagamiensis]
MTIKQLQTATTAKLKPYQSARSTDLTGSVWLNANENPYLNPAIKGLEIHANRYPQPQPEVLIQAYADYATVAPNNVLVTRGADEGIELLIRSFCEPSQDSILITSPTYGMYAVSANSQNVGVIDVPLDQDFQPIKDDISAQIAATKIVFLCCPNNPTGSRIPLETIESILQLAQGKCLVVVDEAYIEFSAQPSAVNLLEKYPNLVILRTLSKAFGLAGIRCGFVLANTDIIQIMKKQIAPYPLCCFAIDTAIQALQTPYLAWMKESVKQINQQKQSLQSWLKETLSWTPLCTSDTNFIAYQFDTEVADSLFFFLAEQDMLVRKFDTVQPSQSEIRITMGTPQEMSQLKKYLSLFFAKNDNRTVSNAGVTV